MKRRLTRQRETILDILKDRYDHPTADQLFLEIHRVIPGSVWEPFTGIWTY